MKNFKKTLLTAIIMACLSVTNAWGDDIYLATSQTVNSTAGSYSNPPSAHKFTQNGSTYTLTISASSDVYFRIYVSGWSSQMCPTTDKTQLTVGGAAQTMSYNDMNDQGNYTYLIKSNTFSSYNDVTIELDMSSSSNRTIKLTGTAVPTTPTVTIAPNGGTFTTTALRSVTLTASNGATVYYTTDGTNPTTSSSSVASGGSISVRPTASGTTVKAAAADGAGVGTIASATYTYVDPATVTASYFLVGNFFWSGADDASLRDYNDINYSRRIFKFTEQKDGSYAVDIPATVNTNLQILGVDGTTETIYGPGEAAYNVHATWPATGGNISGSLTSQNTLSQGSNYWYLATRNDGTHDDDGIYTVSFTLTNGVPTGWKITHNVKKRLAFFLSTAPGAVAVPMYDNRNGGKSDAFSNKTQGYLHFDPSYSYYLITNVLHKDWASDGNQILGYAFTGSGAHSNVNNSNVLPTANKLMFCGNGGFNFQNQKPKNEFSPNEGPMTATGLEKGTYKIEFNPSNGSRDSGEMTVDGVNYPQNRWSALYANHKAVRGQVIFLSDGNSDITIKSVSLVGPAFPNSMSGTTWQWTSAAYDMTYDVTDNSYTYTIESQDSELSKFFRFVANHKQKTNWYETNTQAAIPYDGTIANGYSAATTKDPNDVAFTTNGTAEHTDLTNTDNIIWNRPSGQWTIRFYIKHDATDNESYYYTITGQEYIPVNISGLRTFSYNVAVDLPTDGSVRAYEAYSYDKGSTTAASDQHGVVSLRRLRYIPANMGVVLKVDGATTTSTAQTVRLLKRNVDNTTYTSTTDDEYTATSETDYWHAWSKHGETGYTSTDTWNNYLVATLERTVLTTNGEIDGNDYTARYFALQKYSNCADYPAGATDYFGFFRYKNGGVSGANKAYLRLPSSVLNYNGQFIGQTADEPAGALSAQYLLFDDESELTGIGQVKTDSNRSADNAWYNLQGMRVSHPTKGIYIHQGKKIVIR